MVKICNLKEMQSKLERIRKKMEREIIHSNWRIKVTQS
jgi:hypothetical protein